jgi:hypothetical protein
MTMQNEEGILIGFVTAINTLDRPDGTRKVEIEFQSYDGGHKIDRVQVDPPKNSQRIPTINQLVAIVHTKYFSRVLVEMGDEAFDGAILPGEPLLESEGHSTLHLNNTGGAFLSDETQSNSVELVPDEGVNINSDSFLALAQQIGKIEMKRENLEEKIELAILSGISDLASTKIKITDGKILADANAVEIGNESDILKGGSVVSYSQVIGNYTIDFMTGQLIPHSGVVSESIIPIPTIPSSSET